MSASVLESIGETSILMNVLKCKYEWKIRKFLSYTERDSAYRSGHFHIADSTWFLEIYPNGQTTNFSSGYVSLYLHRLSSIYSTTAEISIGIKTVNRIIVNERNISFIFTNDCQQCGLPRFIDRSNLLRKKLDMMPSDSLSIVCSVEVKNLPVLNANYGQLSNDFKMLLYSKENSDVTLNVGEKTFFVHKVILGARSPVLAAMFKNEMTEKKTGIVDIPDCDPEAFDVFLVYLYSGSLNFQRTNVCELYKIADKYDVSELKLTCADLMIKNLSVENFCDVLIVGDQFSDSKLLTEAKRFFFENFKKIIFSECWELFLEKNFRLANDLLKAMAPKMKLMI